MFTIVINFQIAHLTSHAYEQTKVVLGPDRGSAYRVCYKVHSADKAALFEYPPQLTGGGTRRRVEGSVE